MAQDKPDEPLRMLRADEVAFRLGLAFADFRLRWDTLRAHGFPPADPATETWNPLAIDAWIRKRGGA